MAWSNLDLGVFQETKVMDGIYTRTLEGYRVFAADALSRNQGGGGGVVAVLYWDYPHLQVEALQPHVPNILRFLVVSWWQFCFIVGC